MAEYRINYEQVMGQVRKIKELSRSLYIQTVQLENIQHSVESGWESPASIIFLNRLKGSIDSMKKTKKDMDDLARKIEKLATDIKKEDERQSEIAVKLS